jgi:hypothetical protein
MYRTYREYRNRLAGYLADILHSDWSIIYESQSIRSKTQEADLIRD